MVIRLSSLADAQVIYVDSTEKAQECLDAVERAPGLLYWDTETTGLLVRSGTQDVARIIQVSVRPWDRAWVFDARDDTWYSVIEDCFRAAENVCAHNTKFDMHVMDTYGIDVQELVEREHIWDTTWLAHFHDERTSRRLKDLGRIYLGVDAAKDQRALKKVMNDNDWDWETVPLRHLVQYGGMDAIIGGELFDLLYPRVEPYAMEALRREQRLQPFVYQMERNGIRIDVPGTKAMLAREEAKLADALSELADIFGREVVPKADRTKKDALNLASGNQLKMAFRALGHPIKDTQAVTFNKLAVLAKEGSPGQRAARALLIYKKCVKTIGTYLKPWLRDVTEAGRIHPSFNTLGTITGRFSSSDPNFQNVSKKGGLRDLIIAEDGYTLVVADYDQMELRQFAHYANDERMRAAFLSGDDLYQQVADLLGVSRDIGKMITLASQYGAGWVTTKRQAIVFAFKLGQEDRVPELERLDWKELMEKFHANYKVRWLADMCDMQAQKRGNFGEQYIRTVGGRRMRPKLIRKKATETRPAVLIPIFKDLGNSLIQGSCADLMKEGIIAAGEAGYGGAMRLTVHDELVLEVPEHAAERTLQEVSSYMERLEYVPPLTVSGDAAKRYGDAK